MIKEIWKEYVHSETGKVYHVSNLANVKSIAKDGSVHVHSHYKNNGYRCIPYQKSTGKRGLIYLHKIIANLFLANPNQYKKVKFENGDTTNCMAHNLKWISAEEAAEMNKKQLKPYDIYPNYAPNSKLSTARVSLIKRRIKENQKAKKTRWTILAKQFNITPRHLWLIRTNKVWSGVEPHL